MKCAPVLDYKRQIDYLFAQASEFEDNEELLAHWAKYLCVIVSGFLEAAIREILSEYVLVSGAPSCVVGFVCEKLNSFNNANMENITKITRSFNPNWADCLKLELDDSLKTAVNNVVRNRHQIAHGRASDVTYKEVLKWYTGVLEVIDKIEEKCEY